MNIEIQEEELIISKQEYSALLAIKLRAEQILDPAYESIRQSTEGKLKERISEYNKEFSLI